MWSWIAAGISEELAEQLYEDARAGSEAPEWIQTTMPSPAFAAVYGWDADNPVWHLWRWAGTDEAGEGAGVVLDEFPELRVEMIERWNVEFWIPLYQACCDLSYPDYMGSLRAILPVVEQVSGIYGREFIAPWYADIVEGFDGSEMLAVKAIDADEYLRRREELGCPAGLMSPDGIFQGVTPPTMFAPFTPAFPATKKTFPWAWTAFGVLVVTAAVALYAKPKKKRRRKK